MIQVKEMKCDVCKEKIEENFLKKPIGTYVKDVKGKKHLICPSCQQKFPEKAQILKNL